MSNLHLVTGYAGQAHVTAADDGSFNTAIFGSGEYVFDIGGKFAASVVSNNKITIADGDLLMQGRHVRLNEGTSVALTINNGAQGKLRNDLIVARYTKDSDSGVEQVNLVVIQGTAADSDPADPAYTSGDIINDHALLNDMPLYRVPLDGLNVGTPVALFDLASVKNSDANLADAVEKRHKHTNKTTLDTYNKTQTELLQQALSNAKSQITLGSLGAVSIKKLWQNAYPGSVFAPQSLSLDFSGCSHVLVLAYADTGHAYTVSVIGTSGIYAMATVAWGNTGVNSHRLFSFGAESIWIDSGYSGNTVNNSAVIPYQIYGIKGVT